MIKVLTFSDFVDEFYRARRKDNFSYNAKKVLFEHLEDNFPDEELDVIGLCCSYSEMEVEEVLNEYALESIDDFEGVCLPVPGMTTVLIENI